MDAPKIKMIMAVVSAILIAFALLGASYYLFPTQGNLSGPPFPLPSRTGTTYYVGSPTTLPAISIGQDGTINSTTAPISRIGETYTLTGNIVNYTLTVYRDNVIVDGAGHDLQGFSNGYANAYRAIIIQDRNNVTILNFKLSDFWQAIFIQNSTNVTINGNTLNAIGSTGIYINSANNTAIKQNSINDVAAAIYVTNFFGFGESSNTVVSENNITNTATGVSISPGSFNVISENNFAYVQNVIGDVGNSTIISKNNMISGIEGIGIGGAFGTENNLSIGGSNCTVSMNYIENFSDIGITVTGPYNNIYENTVKNASVGLWLQTSNWTETKNNVIYDNNFFNNTLSARIDAPSQVNQWDNGKVGNYWSDYKGTDNDNNGIGDTPYVVNANNTDRYPLMIPYGTKAPLLSSSTYASLLGTVLMAAIAIAVGTMLLTRRTNRRKQVRK